MNELSDVLRIRGVQVMLDSDLAQLYGVETKALNQAVKRNLNRFPDNYMFQLQENEFISLRSQFVTSNYSTQGGRRYLPFVFTEHGVAMLSAVLLSSEGSGFLFSFFYGRVQLWFTHFLFPV